jgi:hypothetical protein
LARIIYIHLYITVIYFYIRSYSIFVCTGWADPIRHIWQESHQIYGHMLRTFMVLANPSIVSLCHSRAFYEPLQIIGVLMPQVRETKRANMHAAYMHPTRLAYSHPPRDPGKLDFGLQLKALTYHAALPCHRCEAKRAREVPRTWPQHTNIAQG